MAKTLQEMSATARTLANDLFGSDCPCVNHRIHGQDADSCITREENRKLTKEEKAKDWCRRPFFAYDPANMCDSCAAYFHVELAAQMLHRMDCNAARKDAIQKRILSVPAM